MIQTVAVGKALGQEARYVLPNFFIVGTPKSGTTSLFRYLDEHPQVFMCPVKEPNFFSHEDLVRQGLYYSEKGVGSREDYERLFDGATNERALGEASVSYLFYEGTPGRIRACVPEARILIILRDPIDRAYSHYLMDRRLGYVTLEFDDVVRRRASHPLLALYYQQYVELGLYSEQVRRYLEAFGAEQVRIFLHEDLREGLPDVISSVCDFLGIDAGLMPDPRRSYNVYQEPRNALVGRLYAARSLRRAARAAMPQRWVEGVKNALLIRGRKPEVPEATRRHLQELFRPDVLRTGALIGRDLSRWCRG